MIGTHLILGAMWRLGGISTSAHVGADLVPVTVTCLWNQIQNKKGYFWKNTPIYYSDVSPQGEIESTGSHGMNVSGRWIP